MTANSTKFPDQVQDIHRIEPITQRKDAKRDQQSSQQQDLNNSKHDDNLQEHFDAVAKAAESANLKLIEKHSPYRFCIYHEDQDIFIDIIVLDENYKVNTTIKKKITHEEFQNYLTSIESGEGLVFDEAV